MAKDIKINFIDIYVYIYYLLFIEIYEKPRDYFISRAIALSSIPLVFNSLLLAYIISRNEYSIATFIAIPIVFIVISEKRFSSNIRLDKVRNKYSGFRFIFRLFLVILTIVYFIVSVWLLRLVK